MSLKHGPCTFQIRVIDIALRSVEHEYLTIKIFVFIRVESLLVCHFKHYHLKDNLLSSLFKMIPNMYTFSQINKSINGHYVILIYLLINKGGAKWGHFSFIQVCPWEYGIFSLSIGLSVISKFLHNCNLFQI